MWRIQTNQQQTKESTNAKPRRNLNQNLFLLLERFKQRRCHQAQRIPAGTGLGLQTIGSWLQQWSVPSSGQSKQKIKEPFPALESAVKVLQTFTE